MEDLLGDLSSPPAAPVATPDPLQQSNDIVEADCKLYCDLLYWEQEQPNDPTVMEQLEAELSRITLESGLSCHQQPGSHTDPSPRSYLTFLNNFQT